MKPMSSSPATIDGTDMRAVDEFAMLDLDAELLEIALLARDVVTAAGDERPVGHPQDCRRRAAAPTGRAASSSASHR